MRHVAARISAVAARMYQLTLTGPRQRTVRGMWHMRARPRQPKAGAKASGQAEVRGRAKSLRQRQGSPVRTRLSLRARHIVGESERAREREGESARARQRE